MSLRTPEMVLIDVDGTLVDSVPDIAFCANAMLQELDMATYNEERVREWIGNGVERLVRRALIGKLEGEPDEGLFHRAMPLFLDCYTHNVCVRSYLYPGVREGLAFLKAMGFKLGSVTNKAAQFTEPLLEKLGILDDFAIVISGDTLPHKKPHPEPLLHAARFFNVVPGQALLVGDSVNDVQAARAAGFQVACVTYGYNHGDDIREANPDAVMDSLAELPRLLGQAQNSQGDRQKAVIPR